MFGFMESIPSFFFILMTDSESDSQVDLLLVATIRVFSSLILFLLSAVAHLMGSSLEEMAYFEMTQSGYQEW